MYKIVFRKIIWTKEEKDVTEYFNRDAQNDDDKPLYAWLRKDIELPFTPYIGLEIEATDDGWTCPPLTNVKWYSDTSTFACRLEDKYPGWRQDTYLTFEDLVELDLDCGWEWPEKGGGKAPRPPYEKSKQ